MTALPFLTPLSADQQRAFGLPTPQPVAMADRVRFGEVDRLGHVNNVEYLRWFETARVRYFMEHGLTGYQQSDGEPRIVIRRGEADYLSEMRQDEVYVATARTISYRKSSFIMDQELWVARDGGPAQAAHLRAVMVLLQPDGSGRWTITPEIAQRFQMVDGAEPQG